MKLNYFVDDTKNKYYFDNIIDANTKLLELYIVKLENYIKICGNDLGYFDPEIWICICDKESGIILEYLVPSIDTKNIVELTPMNIHEKLKVIHVLTKAFKEILRNSV